jgi:hypothetical protein
MADGGSTTATTTETTKTTDGGSTTSTSTENVGTTTADSTLLSKDALKTTTTTTETPPTFGEKWREELATGEDGKVDEDWLKKLQRYKSPKDYDKAHRAAVAKILEGAKHEPLPDKPTPEQLTAWRKANGIPEKPDGYEIKLADGLKIEEAEKPLVDSFLKKLHDGNASPAFANLALNWYYENKEAEADARADADKTAKSEAEEHLREVWGPDFKTNLNVIGGLIDTMPEGVREKFRFGRLADGTPIGADPDVMNALAGWARQLNPIGTVIPLGSGNAGADAEKELAGLKAEMGNPHSAYWKGADAQKKQDRFGELSKALQAGKR